MKSRRIALVGAVGSVLVALLVGAITYQQRATTGYIYPTQTPQSIVDLPILYEAPAFVLTDANGQSFESSALKGDVWVAEFMFTSCPGICPTMTEELKRVFEAFPDESDLQIVSFTVDPNIDTPEVLKSYAESHGTVSDRWHRLTGEQETLHNLAGKGFKVGSLTNIMDHSSNFVLVDRQGNIRGYYDSLEADEMAELIADIKTLL